MLGNAPAELTKKLLPREGKGGKMKKFTVEAYAGNENTP
jgi:hypothetical protein